MNVIIKNLDNGIKNVIINDPKTYNSLSYKTINELIKILKNDSLSPVAPFRIVNIGNSNKIKLIDFIDAIEKSLGKKAIRNFMPMQKEM